MGIISPINTLAMIFYVCIERVMSHKHEIPSGASVRGEGGEAGEWKLVMPNFYSWGKCIMLLTNRLCLLTLTSGGNKSHEKAIDTEKQPLLTPISVLGFFPTALLQAMVQSTINDDRQALFTCLCFN